MYIYVLILCMYGDNYTRIGLHIHVYMCIYKCASTCVRISYLITKKYLAI